MEEKGQYCDPCVAVTMGKRNSKAIRELLDAGWHSRKESETEKRGTVSVLCMETNRYFKKLGSLSTTTTVVAAVDRMISVRAGG